jgi:hypothetical protein
MTARHDNVGADFHEARPALCSAVPRPPATSSLPALAFVIVAALALTAAAAWPVIVDPYNRLFGHELVGREHDPFTVMDQWAAGYVPPPYFQPATDGPGIALTPALGRVPAFNLITLLSIPATAVLAFAHARYVIGSMPGAIVAALLFGLAPFHLAHAAYHVHVAQVQWIPLFFLTIWRLLDRPTPARAASAAGALLLVTAASVYLGFFAAVVGLAAATTGAPRVADRRRRTALLWSVAAFATAGAVMLAAVLITSPQLLTATNAFAFGSETVAQHTASWRSFVAPPPDHPLLNPLAERIWPVDPRQPGFVEQQLSLGFSVLALAAIGLIGASDRSGRLASLRWPLLVAGLVAFVCSLPPTVRLGSLDLPMPSQVLHAGAPMFRAYARFGVFVSLVLTTAAGAGAAWLLSRRSRAARATLAILLSAAVIEYVPPVPLWRDVLPTPAHRALIDRRDARVLDCTTASAGATAGLSWLMKAEVVPASGAVADCFEPELGHKLAAFGFTHVILRRDVDRLGWIANGANPHGTARMLTFPEAALVDVRTPKPSLYIVEATGLYPREFQGADSWRWMGARGTLSVANLTSEPRTGFVDLELEPLTTGTSITVVGGERERFTWAVTPGRRWYTAGPIAFAPGTQSLAIEAADALVPAAFGLANDPRALSVRVRGWRVRNTGE